MHTGSTDDSCSCSFIKAGLQGKFRKRAERGKHLQIRTRWPWARILYGGVGARGREIKSTGYTQGLGVPPDSL